MRADAGESEEKAQPINLEPSTEQRLVKSIRQFFADELEEDIGEIKARTVLEFFLREVGPSVYNQAIADAQVSLERAVIDLAGERFEPEFDYWKRRPQTTASDADGQQSEP